MEGVVAGVAVVGDVARYNRASSVAVTAAAVAAIAVAVSGVVGTAVVGGGAVDPFDRWVRTANLLQNRRGGTVSSPRNPLLPNYRLFR